VATIAIGDIHGNLLALDDLLACLRDEVDRSDTMVFLGDYIDRGPDSRGCIDSILAFRGAVSASVVCLRGNHEDWLLRTLADYSRHSWLLGMEAFDTIRSYSPDAADALREAAAAGGRALVLDHGELPYELFFRHLPPVHRAFFEGLVPYYRGPAAICVHGGLDPDVPRLEDQTLDALMWGANGFPDRYRGVETVVYGHRENADLDLRGWPHPKIIGATIGLDTISHGVLTAMRLEDGRVFQSARYLLSSADV